MDTSRDLLVLVFLNNVSYTTSYILSFDICLILAMKITALLVNIKT